MAPKKLTDCPENLREAIDWLIQVRHGGDGQGLGELAKALKKLIEEAITKATKSLEVRRNQLECPEKYYSGKRDESYCTETEKQIHTLKSEIKGLNGAVKSKKDKELKKLQSEHDEHITNDHPLSEEERQNKIEEQNNNFKKLKGSLEAFIGKEGTNGECEKILTNLCSGLEKFLGFNPESKGYKGTGIVYSDLDRLCDGVMGFLHGVLKDVSEKQPYSVGKNTLDRDILTLLNNNLCSGHEGFKRLFTVLPQRIAEYNSEVQQGNERVKRPIEKLKNDMKKYTKEELDKKFSHEKLDDFDVVSNAISHVDTKLKECIRHAETFNESIRNAEKHEAIRDLDNACEAKVDYAVKIVKHEYDRLYDLSWKEKYDLEEIVKQIIKVLEYLKMQVNDNITKEVNNFLEDLKKIVRFIEGKLHEVSSFLQDCINKLSAWMQAALKVIAAAEGRIDNEILPRVQDGHEKNKGRVGNTPKTTITQKANDLKTKGDDLLKAYEESYNGLSKLKQEIEEGVKAVETAYTAKLKSVREAVIKDVDDVLHNNQQHSLNKLDDAVRSGLENLRDRIIHSAITGFVATLESVKYESSAASLLIRGNGASGSFSQLPETELKKWIEKAKENLEQGKIHIPISYGQGEYKLKHLMGILDGIKTKIDIQVINALQPISFFGAIGKDFHKEIKKALGEGTDGIKLETLMPAYYGKTKKSVKRDGLDVGTLRGLIMGIKNEVNYMKADNPEEVDVESFDGYQHKRATRDGDGAKPSLTKNVGKVQTHTLQAFVDKHCVAQPVAGSIATVDEQQRALKSMMSDVTTQLEQIAWLLDSDTIKPKPLGVDGQNVDSIKQRLEALKTKINLDSGDELTDIRNKIVNLLGDTLHKARNAANRFINHEADELRDKYIKQMHDFVNERIGFSINALTTAARRNYVTSVKQLLTAFADKVSQELQPLPGEIDKDLTIGFKGLMRKVETQIRDFKKDDLKTISTEFNTLGTNLMLYVEGQTKGENEISLETLKKSFNKLFTQLSLANASHYDHIVAEKHEKLKEEIVTFSSKQFAAPPNPELLDTVKSGFTALVDALDKAYINKYEGHPAMKWVEVKEHQETLTADATRCAKVFVTILGMIFEDLSTLKTECDRRFSKSTISLSSDLGGLFKRYGYVVAKDSQSQDGELRRHAEMTGKAVREKIVGDYPCVFNSSADTKHAIDSLFDYLETYNQVCHLSTFNARRQPCSVYEMLVWFAGLPYNNVYAVLLSDGLTSVLTKPKRKPIETGDDDFEVEFDDLKAYYADTYPNRVTHGDINAALDHVCSTSYDVLATIAGHGDEFTTYAADFCTNSLKLKYPASGEECLHTIVDMLRRMLPQLRYLFSRCKLSAMHGGWSQCLYGKDVTTTKWPCNNHSTDKPSTKANCQPTSPLMSYISDSLPGHQPHQLSSIGCKYDCANCPSVSKKGMPCLTPLGFRGFSGSTRRGEDICEILEKLFSNFYLSSLFCLVPKTPASLPEHYGFVLSLVEGWNSTKTSRKGLIMESIEDAIKKQSIELYDDTSKLTNALANAYGSSQTIHQNKNHLDPLVDLSSLSMNIVCRKKDEKLQCAPYLTSLCVDAYIYSNQKQSNTYLSWAIYLPWTFWDLLNNLYNSFCSINCQDWGCRGCLRGDKCKKGEHGVVDDEKKSAICQCPSIVDCKGVAPTLYQYGFVFGEASTLNDKASPKKCTDFCSQLKNVLESQYFRKLFEECDNFLWTIRTPFSYLVLALWLLSLLYLIHIMVIRLDLLHIKSHLHSPSSHRIAAQSLLAAARVGKLAKISYLQP